MSHLHLLGLGVHLVEVDIEGVVDRIVETGVLVDLIDRTDLVVGRTDLVVDHTGLVPVGHTDLDLVVGRIEEVVGRIDLVGLVGRTAVVDHIAVDPVEVQQVERIGQIEVYDQRGSDQPATTEQDFHGVRSVQDKSLPWSSGWRTRRRRVLLLLLRLSIRRLLLLRWRCTGWSTIPTLSTSISLSGG